MMATEYVGEVLPLTEYTGEVLPLDEKLGADRMARRQPYIPTEELTGAEKVAAAADKVLSNLGEVMPWLPNRQTIVNVAAGMVPGILESAPRVQNVATEGTGRSTGRLLKPAETLLGMKAAQAVTAIPAVARMATGTQGMIGGAAAGATGGVMSGDPLTGVISGTVLGGAVGRALGSKSVENLTDEVYRLASTWKAGARGQVVNWLNKAIPDPQLKQQAVRELNQLAAIVPGEQPTIGLAAVTGSQRIPALKAIEEQARRSTVAGAKLADMDVASEAARVRPFSSVAAVGERPSVGMNEPALPSRAEATRKTITSPLYEAAKRETVEVDDTLKTLLTGDLVQPALSRAEKVVDQSIANALSAGKTPALSGRTPETIYRGYDLPEWSVAGPRTPDVVKPSKISVGALQQFKKELDKDIASLSNATDGAGLAKLAELRDAKAQLRRWMSEKSPKFAEAEATFRDLSQYQNQADVAKTLLAALQSPGGGERSGMLLSAMRDAPSTLRKSDLGSNYAQIGQIMSPTQMRQFRQVVDSLRREEAYKRLTAPNLPAMKSPAEEVLDVVPAIISRPVAFLRKALGKAGATTDTEAMTILNNAATDPKKLAALLQELPPGARGPLLDWVRTNRGGLLGGDISMVTSNIFTDPQRNEGMFGAGDNTP